MKTQSDAELFAMLRGDTRTKESAFTELYSRHSSRVYQYCRYIMDDGDAADDVFQDTFIKFLQSGERGTNVENVPAYLLRIARNLCLNAKRDNKLAGMDDIEDIQIPVEDTTVEQGTGAIDRNGARAPDRGIPRGVHSAGIQRIVVQRDCRRDDVPRFGRCATALCAPKNVYAKY